MINSILVIVPHADDEINVAGEFLIYARDNNIETCLVYSTNSDSVPEWTETRHRESLRVCSLFNIGDIRYLGYHDEGGAHYNDEKIYNSIVKKVTHRYIDDFQPFENDLYDVITEKRADLILTVDYDRNIDHRRLSISFDRVMGRILKEIDYKPIILKKFAYVGRWYGRPDLFQNTENVTLCKGREWDGLERNDCFPYLWKDRIRLSVDESALKKTFWNTDIFKALYTYNSQLGILHYCGIVNRDNVFFYRSAGNLCLYATINVSSGNARFLNDFMLLDTCDLFHEYNDLKSISDFAWRPDVDDRNPSIEILFSEAHQIHEIVVYQIGDWDNNMCSQNGLIKEIIVYANGRGINYILGNGIVNHIILDESIYTDRLSISITEAEQGFAIREIEIYNSSNSFPYEEIPFGRYTDKKNDSINSTCESIMIQAMYKCISIYSRIVRKVKQIWITHGRINITEQRKTLV